MNRILIALFALSVVFCSPGAFAQHNRADLLQADFYYNHYAFHEAIPYYEKVADQVNDATVYSRTGDCYRLTNNMRKAAEWYAKAVTRPFCKNEVLLHYAQALMSMEKYDEAAKWLRGYRRAAKNDRRAANLEIGCKLADKIVNGIPAGDVTLAGFNTNASEFAPTLWKGNLVFTADTAIGVKKKTDRWSGNSYYGMYMVPCDVRGHCDSQVHELTRSRNISIKFHDGPCTFSGDGSQMYFTRTRYKEKFLGNKAIANKDSIVLLEVMVASDYDSIKKEFKTVHPFQFNSDQYSVAHATVSPGGKMLVFASNKPGGYGGTDLYVCRKLGDGSWSDPENIGRNINTEGEEVFPYLADDVTLYFSSDGHEGIGGLDIYMTRWNSKTRTFSAPRNVGIPLNSSYDDISLALFADGRSSYFSSNRLAEKRNDNIYFFKRHQVFVNFLTIDSLNRKPIANVKFTFSSEKDDRDTSTDESGQLFTPVFPGMAYAFDVTKHGYHSRHLSVTMPDDKSKETDTVSMTVALLGDTAVRDVPVVVSKPAPSYKEEKGPPKVDKIYTIGHIPFDYDKSNLNATAKAGLDSLVTYLQQYPGIRILVRAHTDCREKTPGYNQKLSNRRARAVVDYLVKRKIASKRLESIGLSYYEPIVRCPICKQCTEDQHYQNRLLDFKVLSD
jgi:outer membrane protein OmpA-like peptidoglycan-associated protein